MTFETESALPTFPEKRRSVDPERSRGAELGRFPDPPPLDPELSRSRLPWQSRGLFVTDPVPTTHTRGEFSRTR